MAQTLEELKQQAETYESLIGTVQGDAQQSLLKGLEATQGKIAAMEAPPPAPVEGPPLIAPQPQPIAPQVSPTGQIVNDPRLRPAEEVQQEIQATSPETPRFEQENPQITPEQAEQEGIKEVSLASVPGQPQQQTVGMAPQMLTSTQTTIKPGIKVSDELKQAIGETPAALSALGEVETELGALEVDRHNLLQDYQKTLSDFKREEDKRLSDHREDIEKKLGKYDAEAEEIAKEKIDSKKWWKNASTGQRIGIILASALGAIGQGMSGGQTNLAVSSINAAIDRDVKDQLANLDNRKEANKNYMKRIRNISKDFNTDQARHYAAMDLNIKPIIKKLDGLERTAQNAVQRGNIAKLKQGLIDTRVQLKAKIEQAQQPQITKTILSKPTGGAKSAKELREQTKFEQQQRALTVPGFKGKAFTPKKADEIRNGIERYNIMKDTIDKLKGLKSTSLEDRARADSIVKGLIGNLRVQLVGPGALTEGDMKLLNRLLPSPTDLLQLNNMVRLETILENMQRNITQAAKTQGLTATDPRFGAVSAGRKYAK